MTGPTASIGAAGTVLAGRYEIVRHLARGGMGDVLEAHDRQLDRSVAIKLLQDGADEHEPRFQREVELLARLNHPNLVQVYDAGSERGCRFVVLELVDGPPLRRVLTERGRLPEREVAALGAELAGALQHVHESGVVHRDVTPGNVLVGADGRPRLTDFGIARLTDAGRVTATGTTIGTVAYMSPEQVQGHDVGPPSDVYALGLVLLEALTGRRAFEGTTAEVAVARLVRDPDTSEAPAAWRPLLTTMTARDPGQRPSAREVRERLTQLRGGPAAAVAPAAAAAGVDATRPIGAADATAELPAALAGAAAPAAGGAPVRNVGWGIAAGLVVAVLLGLASRSGGIEVPATTTPVAEAEATTASTTTTEATTTTVAPAPPPEPEDDDRDEGDDDDDDDDEGEGRGGPPPGKGKGRDG